MTDLQQKIVDAMDPEELLSRLGLDMDELVEILANNIQDSTEFEDLEEM
jgi:hypothetical protein